MTDALTRQKLYERIRESSKDEVALEEMIRLGFWPADQDKPGVPEEVVQRKGELERELRALAAHQRVYLDPELAIKELRKKKLKAAREKRKETKARREQERYERARAWQQRRQQEILYLGAEVSSAGLTHTESKRERLQRYDLPELADAAAVAKSMGISLAELRFLTFARKTSRVSHYQRFAIAKKTGGLRVISAPMPRLKRAQYWLLDNVLNKAPVHTAAHGFLQNRSIVSNAQMHCGQDVVVNADIKDFFPSVTYRRIKGVFQHLGYNEQVATVFALLCSEADTDEVELDGETFFVAKGPRTLPQGAPTSPAVTNILCRRLDARLAGTATRLGFAYSRYADDMTFSAAGEARKQLGKLLWRLGQIVSSEGFTLHPDKLRIMRRNSRQEVTGLVVNEKISISRKKLREFRALLHLIEKHGPQGRYWGNGGDVLLAINGFAHFVKMVDPAKGQPLVERVRRIHEKLAYQIPKENHSGLSKTLLRQRAAAGAAPYSAWWQPQQKELPPPVVETETTTTEQVAPEKQLTLENALADRDERRPANIRKQKISWLNVIMKIVIVIAAIRLLFWLLGRIA